MITRGQSITFFALIGISVLLDLGLFIYLKNQPDLKKASMVGNIVKKIL